MLEWLAGINGLDMFGAQPRVGDGDGDGSRERTTAMFDPRRTAPLLLSAIRWVTGRVGINSFYTIGEETVHDPVFMTAAEIAQLIRERKASASEVLEAHLRHIAEHNPRLNAIVTPNEEAARQRAKEADDALSRGEVWGPLHGVPITIKDAYETAGLRTTSSFKPLAKYIPQQDATVVARLRAAGAIILGKTNMPELASDGQSNSPIFGRANNPWDITCTPGGSTGGGWRHSGRLIPPGNRQRYCGLITYPGTLLWSVRFQANRAQRICCRTYPAYTGRAPEHPAYGLTWSGGPFGGGFASGFRAAGRPDQRDWTVPPVPMTMVPGASARVSHCVVEGRFRRGNRLARNAERLGACSASAVSGRLHG